jgi:hypothetical protein
MLKNNEELLNKRIIKLKERDNQAKQKQFLLDSIKQTFIELNDNVNFQKLKKKIMDSNFNENLVAVKNGKIKQKIKLLIILLFILL